MTRRERTLLIAVIASVVAAVGLYGNKRVQSWFASRTDRIEQLESEIHRQKKQVIRGIGARRSIQVYEGRSLPSEPELASSRYRAWLHQWMIKAGVSDHQVAVQGGQRLKAPGSNRVIYDKYAFSVSCQGSLEQWVRLLYQFYRADHLHRIKSMSVTPMKDSSLSLAFTIEALSLPGAGKDKPLASTPSQRLAYATLADYLARIVTRNPYGPANEPPRFASSTTQNAYVGQPADLEIRAQDPEGQRVRYRLVGNLPGDARFDERSGELRWTPPEKGEYEVTVVAEDEGVPPKSVETKIRIVVDDPPPEQPAAPAFDIAKFTFVTGLVSVDGRPEVWLHDRPQDRLLKLHEGDEFEVGSYKGKILAITHSYVDIQAEGQVVRLKPGQNLRQGQTIQRDAVADAQ